MRDAARILRVILAAELRQHLRDPLTLALMVVVPLFVYPMLGAAGSEVVRRSQETADAEVLDVATEPAFALPDNLHRVDVAELEAAVRDGRVAAAARRTTDGADLWWDSREPDSLDARVRLRGALDDLRAATATRRVETHDTMTKEDRTRQTAAGVLPLLLLFTLLTGGLYTALDVVTGEKERGTVETLLTTAVDRRLVLGGKFLLVLLFTGLSTVFTGLSSWISARFLLDMDLPASTVAVAVLLFFPMAVLLSAVLCAAAAWAQDFKSGQVLTMPVLIIPLLLACGALLPGIRLTVITAVLPVTGLALALREVVCERVEPGLLALAFLAHALFAAGALYFGSRLIGREDVILGSRGSSQRRLRGDYRADALTLFAIACLSLWFLGQTAQALDIRAGMAFTQVGLFVPLALAAPWWLGLSIRGTLRLHAAPRREWLRAVVVGVSMPGLALCVGELVSVVLPAPTSLFEGIFPEAVPLWQLLLFFAVLPGVCEELLFRGAFFGLWCSRGAAGVAVLVTALAFGLFHLSLFRFFPTTVLGVLLGFISIRSRSVLPGMLAHVLNNGLAMVAFSLGWSLQFGWPMVAAAVVAVGALLLP